jgi:hypothetical protein
LSLLKTGQLRVVELFKSPRRTLDAGAELVSASFGLAIQSISRSLSGFGPQSYQICLFFSTSPDAERLVYK